MVQVTGNFGEKPTLQFPSATAPEGLKVEVLEKGDGPVVKAGDQLTCNYLGQVWGGEVFDNSYDLGEPLVFPIGMGWVIEGWDQGLVGQTVGSRVLLSIPSDLGYGPAGQPAAGIKGDDTLVFVTDIIAGN